MEKASHWGALAGLVLMVVLPAGCTATGTRFPGIPPTEPEEPLIIVYRPDQFVCCGIYANLYLDGQKKAPLKNAGYVLLHVTPGEHGIEIKGGTSSLGTLNASFEPVAPVFATVDVGRGEVRFLRFWFTLSRIAPGMMTPVSRDVALKELESLRLSE